MFKIDGSIDKIVAWYYFVVNMKCNHVILDGTKELFCLYMCRWKMYKTTFLLLLEAEKYPKTKCSLFFETPWKQNKPENIFTQFKKYLNSLHMNRIIKQIILLPIISRIWDTLYYNYNLNHSKVLMLVSLPILGKSCKTNGIL